MAIRPRGLASAQTAGLWYNARTMRMHIVRWSYLGWALWLAACAAVGPPSGMNPTATLVPWRTPTATAAPTRLEPTHQATIEPGPSPTPLTHIVAANDTLLTIASQYGVSLDELLAANPGINPRLLSIGQPLLIPGTEGTPIIATATTIPLTFSPVACSPTATRGRICWTGVRNPTDVILEGLSARIDLLNEQGQTVASAVAFAPLNLLPSGETMPLGAYFSPPVPTSSSAAASDLTAFPAHEVERRYRELSIVNRQDLRSDLGTSWTVRGEVRIAAEAVGPAARVLVLAVGYGAQGEVLGYAVWESTQSPGPGESVPFEVAVLSLAGPMERVRILAEALAAPSP